MHHKQQRETVTNAPCSCPRPKNGGKPAIVLLNAFSLFSSWTVLAPNTPTNLFPSSYTTSYPPKWYHAFILSFYKYYGWISSPTFTSLSDLLYYLTQQFEFRFNPFLSYEAIINAYVQAQLLKHSLFYFSQMINKGLTPGPNTYIIFWVFLSNQIVLRKLCVFSMKQRGIFKWMYVVLGLWLKVVVRLWFV